VLPLQIIAFQNLRKLKIDDFAIKQCNQTRFLGVIIDEKLNWDAHIKYLENKLNYAMSTLCRIMDSIPKELHRNLYYTLFESHLLYCISVWRGVAKYIILDCSSEKCENECEISLFQIYSNCLRIL